jgi:hypothetical protein
MNVKINLNKYFTESQLSRVNVDAATLVEAAENAFKTRAFTEGDKPDTYLITIPTEWVNPVLVTLKPGDTGTFTFEARPGVDELPSKRLRADASLTPDPFDSAELVMYGRTALGRDATHEDSTFELVTIITKQGTGPQPIHPDTLIKNYFLLPGGSPMAISVDEFAVRLKQSYVFWADKVILADR